VIAPTVAVPAEPLSSAVVQRSRRLVFPSALLYQRASGLILVGVLVILVELLGRPAALDPAVALPVIVLAGVVIGGWQSGVVAAVVGGVYIVLYAVQPNAALSGGLAHAAAGLVGTGVVLWLAGLLSEGTRRERDKASEAARRGDRIGIFATELATVPTDELPAALARGAAQLLNADMAVVTAADPATGAHVVRAAHGSRRAAIGVEVQPGAGITGQAISERRVVLSAGANVASETGLSRRLRGQSGASMAAAPGIRAGEVIVTMTVARADGSAFSADDQRMLEQIASIGSLALDGSVA
jgi:hypothetical protein